MSISFLNAKSFIKAKWRAMVRVVLLLALLLLLLMLPISMGDTERRIPGLRHIEEISQNYCAEQLPKIAGALAVTYAVSGLISVLEDLHLSAVLVSAAPFKALSGMNENIKSLGKAMLLCMGLFILGATVMGMITFICFKLLLPAALVLGLLAEFLPQKMAWAGNISQSLGVWAVLLWLFFPVTALTSNYVQKSFLDSRVAEEMRIMEANKEKLSAVNEEAQRAGSEKSLPPAAPAPAPEEHAAPEEDPGWLSWGLNAIGRAVSETADSIGSAFTIVTGEEKMKDKLEVAVALISDLAESMLRVVVMFLLTTIVIPVGVLYLFMAIFKALCGPERRAAPVVPGPVAGAAVSA